jgi:hypothetical protein
MLLVFFLVWNLNGSVRSYTYRIWHCLTTDCNPTGPAISWEDQLAAAENAAHKIDPGAVPISLEASSAYFGIKAWQPNDALELTFTYLTSDGHELLVTVWDIESSHVETRQFGEPKPAFYKANLERKADTYAVLEHIRITPRQAVELTQAKATELSQGKDLHPLLSFFLLGQSGLPRKWYVMYDPLLVTKPDNTVVSIWPAFNVDASSGAIEDVTLTNGSPPSTP